MDRLHTVPQIIDALGGTAGVMDLTGMKYQAAFCLRYRSVFPSKYYLVMTTALAAKGKCAPASLWGMTEPERETAMRG